MSAAQIIIGIEQTQDGNCQMGITFNGDEKQLIPLLGAVSHAEQWLNKRIAERIGEGSWEPKNTATKVPIVETPAELEQENTDVYSSEQKVSRDSAISAILYAIEALQMRVEKIRTSPADSTFIIDPELLAKL